MKKSRVAAIGKILTIARPFEGLSCFKPLDLIQPCRNAAVGSMFSARSPGSMTADLRKKVHDKLWRFWGEVN